MDSAQGEYPADGAGRVAGHGSASTAVSARAAARSTTANVGSWLLVVAFVGLVLSVVVPAMSDSARSDWAAALLFMLGLAATLVGTGMSIAASVAKARAVLGGLLMIAGVVLMYGLVPSLAALGVVLVGAATQLSSLPGD